MKIKITKKEWVLSHRCLLTESRQKVEIEKQLELNHHIQEEGERFLRLKYMIVSMVVLVIIVKFQ